jgi:hypothetical protein
MSFSHIMSSNPIINENYLKTRGRLQSENIDEAVMRVAKNFVLQFEKLNNISQTCNSSVLLRYEDLVNHFDDFIKEFNRYISIPEDRINELYIASRPNEDEDISAHKRSGKIGQYKEKLKPETIVNLNKIFKPVLNKFGYEE